MHPCNSQNEKDVTSASGITGFTNENHLELTCM
jgi:hypothetical protein